MHHCQNGSDQKRGKVEREGAVVWSVHGKTLPPLDVPPVSVSALVIHQLELLINNRSGWDFEIHLVVVSLHYEYDAVKPKFDSASLLHLNDAEQENDRSELMLQISHHVLTLLTLALFLMQNISFLIFFIQFNIVFVTFNRSRIESSEWILELRKVG